MYGNLIERLYRMTQNGFSVIDARAIQDAICLIEALTPQSMSDAEIMEILNTRETSKKQQAGREWWADSSKQDLIDKHTPIGTLGGLTRFEAGATAHLIKILQIGGE